MAVMPFTQCFKLIHVMAKNVITMKVFLRSLILKLLVDFKASKLSELSHFLCYCSLKGGYFSFCGPQNGCPLPLMRGVHLQEVEIVEFEYKNFRRHSWVSPYRKCPLTGSIR